MSKKILSLTLVVVMLASIFAVSANAFSDTSKKIGYKIESDAKVGMVKGDIITVKVYYTIPDGATQVNNLASTSLAYNNTIFEVVDEDLTANGDSFAWGASYDCFKMQATTVQTGNVSNAMVKKFTAAETDKNWNYGVQIQQLANSVSFAGYTVDPNCELFTIQFKVIKDTPITAEDTIGIPTGLAGTMYLRIKTYGESAFLSDASSYDFSENTVATPAAAATPTVEFVKTQSRWAGRVPGEDYEYGFVGKLINFTPTSTSTGPNGNPEVDNISSISATISVDGTARTAYVHTIWQGADGAYYFRASVSGFAYTDTNAIDSVVFTVATADGNLVSVSPAATTVNAIYTASVAAGLTAAA